ncbi:MAG: trypsin-like peptidase domain-containing protein [Candidatus Omnitrophota bacterium]
MKTARLLPAIIFSVFLSGIFSLPAEAADGVRQTPIVKVVSQTARSVVNISTEKVVFLRQNPYWGVYGNDFDALFSQFSTFHGMAPAFKLKSVGSGVIVDKGGLVATNAHVVNMASTIYVILNDGTQLKGELVYEDKDSDLAFVKISYSKPLSEAVLGQTGDLMLGETVVAIGNPLGLENTVTSGILSGKNRKFYSSRGTLVMGDMLQVDAPINPGNSGGPLFNLDAQLIGINVAVVQYSQSIGFAIPVEKLKSAMDEYKRNPKAPAAPVKPKPPPFKSVFGAPSILGLPYETEPEIQDNPEEYLIRFDISGLDKSKVRVEVDKNFIKISGEYSSGSEEKSPSASLKSKSFGSFIRTIPLPEDADPEGAKTDFQGDSIFVRIAKKK